MAPLSFRNIALSPLIAGLKNASAFISKAEKHIQTQNHNPNDYLTASIHPDMKDFIFQVHRFTDTAKLMPPRINPAISGLPLPDVEKTIPELQDRIKRVIDYLEGIDEAQFEGQEEHEVVLTFRTFEVKYTGLEYVLKFVQPNFWFHVATAYDILRMKGVDVGKFDFLNGAGLIPVEPIEKK